MLRSVEAITLDDVKAFYAKYYTRDNVVVGIAGGYPANFAARVRARPSTRCVPAE